MPAGSAKIYSILRTALRIGIAAGLLVFILSRVDLGSLVNVVSSANVTWLFVGLFSLFVGVLAAAGRWSIVLRLQGQELSFLKSAEMSLISNFLGIALPSSAGRDVVRGALLVRYGLSLSEVTRSILIDRYIGTTSLAVVALPGVFLLAIPTPSLSLFGYITLSAVLFLFAVPFFAFAYQSLFRLGISSTFLNRLPRITYFLNQVANGLLHPHLFFLPLLISLFVHVTVILAAYAVGEALGSSIGFMPYALAVPLVSILMTLPISISGIGIREVGFVLLLAPYGMMEERALAISLTFFGIGILVNLIGGVLFLLGKTSSARS